jgi:hypothetical protein
MGNNNEDGNARDAHITYVLLLSMSNFLSVALSNRFWDEMVKMRLRLWREAAEEL